MIAKKSLIISFSFLCLSLLAGCQKETSPDIYQSSAVAGPSKAVFGVVLSSREVTIQNSDKLSNNTAGIVGGSIIGGATGSALSDGGGLGTAIGVIAGALIGAQVEKSASTEPALEYIFLPNKCNSSTTKKTKISIDGEKDISISSDQNNDDCDPLIIVQSADNKIADGEKAILIVPSSKNERTRLIKDTTKL